MSDYQLAYAPNSYGTLERRIARLIGHFPRTKALAKQVYSRAVYHLSGGYDASHATQGTLYKIGAPDTETFFGYYDKSPASRRGLVLCHATRQSSKWRPRPEDAIAIQVFDFSSGDCIHPISSISTACYNWQQGARAHWLDDECFIFNDFDPKTERYVSRVHSILNETELQRYDHAVQDSWGREYFLSINYRRLQALRPDYGYCRLPPLDEQELAALDEDGIWRVEQDSGRSRLIYSLADVCRVETPEGVEHARHKVNHLMIAPDGRRFMFLHRYFVGRMKYDRLMVAASDGSGMRVLTAHGMVSHCFWIDNANLLCYLRGPNGRDGYYQVDVDTGAIKPLLDGALDAFGDGHPHVHGQQFVTDTYPDKRRMQHLVMGDLRSGTLTHLGQFHQDFGYGGQSRCDLHPRWAPDGSGVFFDSVCDGRRRLYFLELE